MSDQETIPDASARSAANNQPIKACIDLQVPMPPAQAMATPAPQMAPTPTPMVPAAFAIVISKKWSNNSVLPVYFMDGDPLVQAKVEAVAHQWSRYCNIRFKFVNDPTATIRISFLQNGSWSYIGRDALLIPSNQPTMNFGWLRPDSPDDEYERVVVHEFGHALGLIHEHQNPAGGIPWNREAVYDYYSGPPNNWTPEQVDVNLFDTYDETQVNFSGFDRESIMLYPVPNTFTIGDFEVGWNSTLSSTDKHWIRTAYPKSVSELEVDGPPRAESISEFGEIDTFTFSIFQRGRYRVETTGRTDLKMSLFGPEDDAIFIAADDDSGQRLNPRILATLDWGRYTVRVQHFSKRRTGDYEIAVKTEQ